MGSLKSEKENKLILYKDEEGKVKRELTRNSC